MPVPTTTHWQIQPHTAAKHAILRRYLHAWLPMMAKYAEIDGCASLAALAARGKRLYALRLAHDQAGVAWSHYRLRKAALEAALTLGAEARTLIEQVEHASPHALPGLGARLYRLQHAAAVAITPAEWRRVWSAYHARRRARAA